MEVSDETDSDVEVQNEEEPAVDVGDGETTNAITVCDFKVMILFM